MSEGFYLLFPAVYVILNLFSFILYGMDKYKAIRDKWRIPEQILLIFSFLGPIGAWLGMQHFRHKTRKQIFELLVPLFIAAHILLALWTML